MINRRKRPDPCPSLLTQFIGSNPPSPVSPDGGWCIHPRFISKLHQILHLYDHHICNACIGSPDQRIRYFFFIFDVIRLDHFAAIVKYYVVPNKAEDGRSGKWSRGPGKKLTDAIEKVIGDTHIIVEDIAGKSPIPGVKKLMARTGWPGIKILMFAFGDDTANEHLPHNYTDCNLVVYAGTHDNETIVGYFRYSYR